MVIPLVVVVTALLVLFVVPIPHSFAMTVRPICGMCAQPAPPVINPPKGSLVSGTYASTGCPSIAPEGSPCLIIVDVLRDTVYTGLESSGSFSFTSQDPPYGFMADNGTVNVSGAISYPLL